jgi:hypothetical protein
MRPGLESDHDSQGPEAPCSIGAAPAPPILSARPSAPIWESYAEELAACRPDDPAGHGGGRRACGPAIGASADPDPAPAEFTMAFQVCIPVSGAGRQRP